MFQKGNFALACDQTVNHVVLYDLDKDNGDLEKCQIWELFLEEKSRGNLSGVKYRENTVYGDVIIVVASVGLAGVYTYPDGKCVWSVESCGNNPHSIEILPNGAVATVCSTGGEVRLYNTETSEYTSYPCYEGHGLLWDPERKILWGLDHDDLYVYEFLPDGKGGTLKEKKKYHLPEIWGHDLSADVVDSRFLNITTGKNVYHFNKDTGEFTVFGGELNHDNCKGYGNNRLGNTIFCFPNKGAGTPWEGKPYASWCTSELYFYDKKSEKLKCYKSDKRAFYKVFSFMGEYN